MWLYDSFGPMPRFQKHAKNHRAWSKIAAWENETQYQDAFAYLANLYINTFEWKNLPATCNEWALERTLFFYGKALFFQDSQPWTRGKYTNADKDQDGAKAYWHTAVTLGEGLNLYWEHVKRRAYSYNYEKEFDITNSILIRANKLMYPPFITTMIYAQKLTDAARTIDVVAENLKVPFIIEGDETDLMSIERFVSRIRNNEGAIITVPGWMEGKIKVNPISGDNGQRLTALWDHKHELQDEYLTRRGINNANTDKKERLVVSETSANDQLIQLSGELELDSRKLACEQINEMFGLNISVDWRHKQEGVEADGFDQGVDPVQGSRD